MSFLKALKDKSLELRKARDPMSGRIALVVADVTARAKEVGLKTGDYEPTDEMAVSAIKKAVKYVNDALALNPNDQESIEELAILTGLLPQQASEADVTVAAKALVAGIEERSMKQMGKIMAALTEQFGAGLDKAQASKIVKKLLSN